MTPDFPNWKRNNNSWEVSLFWVKRHMQRIATHKENVWKSQPQQGPTGGGLSNGTSMSTGSTVIQARLGSGGSSNFCTSSKSPDGKIQRMDHG